MLLVVIFRLHASAESAGVRLYLGGRLRREEVWVDLASGAVAGFGPVGLLVGLLCLL